MESCSSCEAEMDPRLLTPVGADPQTNFNLCPECVRQNDEEVRREMAAGWPRQPEAARRASSSGSEWISHRDWRYHGNVKDLGEPIETCQLCGQIDLRYHFEIVHRTSDDSMWVGSECIKKFDIDVVMDGHVLAGRAAHQQVDRDRRAIEKQARTRSVINSLVRLTAADPEFTLLGELIGYYSTHEAFTPKQMAVLQWRFSKTDVEHNPRHFKVRLRRARDQNQIRRMEGWQRQKLAPYLSAAQRKRWLSAP